MVSPLLGAAAVALLTGGAHFAAHTVAGEEDTFEAAGVRQAGFTVMLVSGGLTFFLLAGAM